MDDFVYYDFWLTRWRRRKGLRRRRLRWSLQDEKPRGRRRVDDRFWNWLDDFFHVGLCHDNRDFGFVAHRRDNPTPDVCVIFELQSGIEEEEDDGCQDAEAECATDSNQSHRCAFHSD